MVAVAAVVVALAVPAVLAAAAEPAGLAASTAAVAVVQLLVAAAAAAEHLRLRHTALGRSAANRLDYLLNYVVLEQVRHLFFFLFFFASQTPIGLIYPV